LEEDYKEALVVRFGVLLQRLSGGNENTTQYLSG
jgi:hypothetical protein